MDTQIGVLPPFEIAANGTIILVDHASFTLNERRMSRVALTELQATDNLIVDTADVVAALIWVVLRRTQPDIEFSEVYDGLTLGAVAEAVAAPSDPHPTPEASDPEE